MTLEEQIKALLEAKQTATKNDDSDNQADRVDGDPAVKIENPMNPALTSSEVGLEPQDEIDDHRNKHFVSFDPNMPKTPIYNKVTESTNDTSYETIPFNENPESYEKKFGVTIIKDKGNGKRGDSSASVSGPKENVKKFLVHYHGDEFMAREMHPAVFESYKTESISDLLGDEFSSEFKLKAQTIFEAAVKDQVMKIEERLQEEQNAAVAKLQAQLETQFAQRSKALEEETSDKIDGYLSFLAEEWKKDNEIALEAAIKTELTESFINNLRSVFEQHYVELPDEKVDLYTRTLEEKTEMENALATTVGNLARLTEELNSIKREKIIEESTKDFSSMDTARFKTLVEDFAFDSEDSFRTKVSIVKKSFFGQKSVQTEQLIEEFANTPEIVESNSEKNIVIENTAMSAYLRALSKK